MNYDWLNGIQYRECENGGFVLFIGRPWDSHVHGAEQTYFCSNVANLTLAIQEEVRYRVLLLSDKSGHTAGEVNSKEKIDAHRAKLGRIARGQVEERACDKALRLFAQAKLGPIAQCAAQIAGEGVLTPCCCGETPCVCASHRATP